LAASPVLGPSSAAKLVTSRRSPSPLLHRVLVGPSCTQGVSDCTAWVVVKVPVDGRFPAGELMRRDPRLFATSAILGDAEAASHIAPPKNIMAGAESP
jgi:hypothetical protein